MNTVNNSYNDKRPSLNHMKRCLEAGMEQLAKEDICLAFSGGVDSSLFLKAVTDAAAHARGNIYIVTLGGRLHPSCDLGIARRVAGEPGGVHEVIAADELEWETIKNDPVNRCYLCRRHLFSKLAGLAQTRGIRHTLGDTNEDDMHVYRPGTQALRELGITSPLTELRITKAQVKALISEYGISMTSRPSTPRVAARLPYGTVLNYEVLGGIGAGEAYARTMVPGNVHLRLRGDIVRLELDLEAFDVFMKCRKEIVSRLKEVGFMYITLDAERFRSGGMDVGLTGLS